MLVFVHRLCYNVHIIFLGEAVTAVNLLSSILLEREEGQRWVMSDQTFITLMIIGGMVLLAVLVVAGTIWWTKFRRELRHLNLRISQSVSERERQHYLRRRRNLLWSIIPFVRYKH